MIIEAEEAAEKWCPFTRVIDCLPKVTHENRPGNAAGNRFADGSILAGARCIGSQCMAWRQVSWDELPESAIKSIEAGEMETPGYCGLAGKP